ncbi:MAG TPA: hypothetical protein VF469_11090 [Kofleriaceae bacterium]
MAGNAIITLRTLRCIRESGDPDPGSEPYLWPVLLTINKATFTVDAVSPLLGDDRVVIKNDMRANETADIPASVGVLRQRIDDDLSAHQLLLVVALWDKDDSPGKAVDAGNLAFSEELDAALTSNLLALATTDSAGQQAIIDAIKARVRTRVGSAIEGSLSVFEQIQVTVGLLDLDDFIDSSSMQFPSIAATSFTLTLGEVGGPNQFEIDGDLQVQPLDPCLGAIANVNRAQARVNQINLQIRSLQRMLSQAPPAAKGEIVRQITDLQRRQLTPAVAALAAANSALQACRALNPQGG